LKNLIFLTFIFNFNAYANLAINLSNNDIFIQSEKIEILKEKNEIHFMKKLKIKNDYIVISADSAIYNNNDKVLNISGNLAEITSSSSKSPFAGKAKNIYLFNDNSIELSGDAYFENDGIKFKSSSIKFNQQNGKVLN
jgi:lipopolysaccharide export system protein LptA